VVIRLRKNLSLKVLLKKIARNFSHLLNHPKTRKLSISIFLGIIISIILHFIGTTQFVEDMLNPMIDKLIRNESDKVIKLSIECHRENPEACEVIKKSLSEHIIFFDIDNKNYLQWGEPTLTPRDKLADAIAIAAQKSAKIIIIDILLYNQACHPEEDKKLIETLKNLAKKDTTIIFSVSLSQEQEIKKSQIKELDNLIDEAPNFYRGLPLILASKDGVVRYFRGYQVVKDKKTKKEVVLWGIPILSVALFTNHLSELKELDKKILNKQINSETLTLSLSNKKIYITSDNIYTNRLRFFMRPPEPYEKKKQGNLSLFQRRTFDVLQSRELYFPDDLAEKIVIIGNSSISQRDIFMTSVGYMPGMYIIGNTINTLLHNNLQIVPSQEPDLFIMLIFIILISFPITFIDNFDYLVYFLIHVCILIIPFVIEFIFDKLTVYTFAERSVFLKMLLVTFSMVIINQQVTLSKSLIKSFQKFINYIKRLVWN
jgi:CHASE2 domain-containing sensor protein